ncbi:MAG: peptidyl-prolyl cis-trans isomerase [Nitrospirae bacterium]|nr:peptidyl-prolyl cis-trans isomerase [Nitrospirota bacterium]
MPQRIMLPYSRSGASPFCFYALILLTIGCGKTGVLPSSPIVAMIDDNGISLKEFRTAFNEAKIEGPLDEAGEPVKELKRNLLNQLIERRLFLAEAARLKLTIGPEELEQATDRIQGDYASGEFDTMLKNRQIGFDEWKEGLRQELLTQKAIRQAVPENIPIADSEIQAYYKQHSKEFVRPTEVRARQIVVADEETAKAIRLQLLQGADFAASAKARSLSPDKNQGGDLGFFTQGEMPEAFDIVFTLEVGKISPIVKTDYGYHLFKVEERHPSKPMNPAEAAERIRAQLTLERREKFFSAWVAGLKEKARITVNYQILYQPLGRSEPFPESAHE